MKLTLAERFWAKVSRGPKCWHWHASKSRGAGRMRIGRVMVPAQNIAWVLTHGRLPSGTTVVQKCRHLDCVKPAHLKLVPAEPLQGEKHGRAKLTAEKVREIRASGLSQRKLAKAYRVGVSTIRNILSRETWKHV